MFTALILALLALVFVAAATSKLANFRAFRAAFGEFTVVKDSTPLLLALGAAMIVLGESLVAIILLIPPLAWLGACCVALLVAIFTAAVCIEIAHGRRPVCNCFGRFSVGRIGAPTLMRNGALFLLSAFVVITGPRATEESLSSSYSFVWNSLNEPQGKLVATVTVLLLLLTGAAVMSVRDRRRRTPQRIDHTMVMGLEVGSPLPPIELFDGGGHAVDVRRTLGTHLPVIFVFLKEKCEACDLLRPYLATWHRRYSDISLVVVVDRKLSEAAPVERSTSEQELPVTLFQVARSVNRDFRAWVLPAAVLVTADGRVGSRLAIGPRAIQELIEQAGEGKLVIPRSVVGLAPLSQKLES